MCFPPGLLGPEPCPLLPTPKGRWRPGLSLNLQSQRSYSPSSSPGTQPHQDPQTVMLGTTLSQRQEVHQWLVCLGQKQTNKQKTLEDGTPREFLGLAADICIALPGEEVSWGLTRLGESWPLTPPKSSCFCQPPATCHAVCKELYMSHLEEPAHWPCDTEPNIPIV